MRELNTQETEAVSGAGLFSDAGAIFGGTIGALVDAFTNRTTGAQIGAVIGNSIGAVADSLANAITGIINLFKKP